MKAYLRRIPSISPCVMASAEEDKGYSNHYTLNYLRCFLGEHVTAGAEVTGPLNKVLQVLPDRMKLMHDFEDRGVEEGYHGPNFDDSKWKEVATYSSTLNAQDLPDIKSFIWYRASIDVPRQHSQLQLFFTEVDGQGVTVYVNGTEVASLDKQARRKPFEVDITDVVNPARNAVAVKVDHRKITELYLGGIVRPVLLIEQPSRQSHP